MHIPPRLGVGRGNVTSDALLGFEHLLAALRCIPIEAAFGWLRRRNRELVEMQRGQLPADQIGVVSNIPKSGTGRDRELQGIVQAWIEKRPSAMHCQIGDQGIPVRYRAPTSRGVE